MFSGIIENTATVRAVRPRGDGRTLVLESTFDVAPHGAAGVGTGDRKRVGLGDSIAVNGVCLTVEAVEPPHTFVVACGKETVDKTTLGGLRVGDSVHLERALRLGDPLDGHIVSGHVDDVGTVASVSQEKESVVIWVEVPTHLARYIATKGSVTMDGVSLTVNEVSGPRFRVNIIPYTTNHTGLGRLKAGNGVNLEVDLLARYLERLVGADAPSGATLDQGSGLTRERLATLGFAGSGAHDGE